MSAQSLHRVVVDQCPNRMSTQKGQNPSEMDDKEFTLAQQKIQNNANVSIMLCLAKCNMPHEKSQVTSSTNKRKDAKPIVMAVKCPKSAFLVQTSSWPKG